MKGAIACFAAAAADFKAKSRDIDGSISLLITGDEEGPAINGTRKVLEWMAEQCERLDHALVGEPTNSTRLGEAIKIGRRGSLNGHASRSQACKATSPIRISPRIRSRASSPCWRGSTSTPLDYGSAHFSPSNFEVTSIDVGNPPTNVIPAEVAEALQRPLQRPAHGGVAERCAN